MWFYLSLVNLHSNKLYWFSTKNFQITFILYQPVKNHAEWLSCSSPEVFCEKGVLKICRKFTGDRPCRNVISIKLLCNLIEIILWHGCSPVNLLHFFRTPFSKNTIRGLFLKLFWRQSWLKNLKLWLTESFFDHVQIKIYKPTFAFRESIYAC